jgi:hypothetical protein
VKIRIEGELVHSRQSGFGPFRRQHRDVETFEGLLVGESEKLEAGQDLYFECVQTRYGWVLQGSLRGISCTFGEFETGSRGDCFSFTMLSVVDWELRGKATILEAARPPQAVQTHFVA